VTLASRSRRSTRPTATCSTSSSRRSPTTATTRTAGASRTAPASSGRSLRPFARSGPTISPSSSASPRPTGSPTATRGTWTTPCGWPPARRGRRRPDRRLRGGIHPDQQLPGAGPGYQVPYAEAIREGTDVPVAAVGGITEPTHADALVRNERADLVALGREMLRHPYWPLEAAHETRRRRCVAGAVPARSVRLTRCRRRRRARIRPVRLRPPRTLREDLFRSREPTAYGVPTLPRRTQR